MAHPFDKILFSNKRKEALKLQKRSRATFCTCWKETSLKRKHTAWVQFSNFHPGKCTTIDTKWPVVCGWRREWVKHRKFLGQKRILYGTVLAHTWHAFVKTRRHRQHTVNLNVCKESLRKPWEPGKGLQAVTRAHHNVYPTTLLNEWGKGLASGTLEMRGVYNTKGK